MALLLGIDIGTTHWKTILFDQRGKAIATAKVETINHSDGYGVVYNPGELWGNVAAMIRQVLNEGAAGRDIAAIAIASMAESGLLVDAHGEPAGPIIPYFDQRSLPQSQMIKARLGADRVYRITGMFISPLNSLTKLLWLKQNQPELFRRAAKWLCIPDYLYYQLTGQYATDYSIGCRTLAMDISSRAWSETILYALGIEASFFAPLYPSGTIIGRITRAAAALTGLAEGTPVVTGGHDHFCGSLAAGLLWGERLINSSGTAESIHTLLKEQLPPTAEFKGFSIGRYVDAEHLYIGGGLTGSGATVDWALRHIAGLSDWGEGRPSLSYEAVFERVGRTAAGANGLLFLPHLRGGSYPHWDPTSRGAWLGLRLNHNAPEMMRAVIEGLCFEIKGMIDGLKESAGYPLRQITAIGGGSRNEFWLQTKADITGLPIEVPDIAEATALGAALLAGLGVGIYQDGLDANRQTYRVRKRFEPRPEVKQRYERLFQVYKRVYERLSGINEALENDVRLNGACNDEQEPYHPVRGESSCPRI